MALLEQTKTVVNKVWTTALSNTGLRICLILAAIVAVLSLAKGCSTDKTVAEYEKQLAIWQTQTNTTLAQNSRVNALVDSLKKENAILIASANSKTTEINVIRANQAKERKKNDSTLAALQNTLPPECKGALDLATSYRAEADSLNLALVKADQRDSVRVKTIANLNTANDSLTASNDSLVARLKTVPVYKEPKLLKIFPYPTRTQAFGAGVVTGILAVVTIVVVAK